MKILDITKDHIFQNTFNNRFFFCLGGYSCFLKLIYSRQHKAMLLSRDLISGE